MFEFSVAWRYLIPRWRQLSVSIISLISVLVISLVVWLILVFFSVANGLESMWVERMIAMSSPVRATPKDAYYQSYYYQIDGVSDSSNYTHKSIAEKRFTEKTDPYDPSIDAELSSRFYYADRNSEGSLKDLVGDLFKSVEEVPGVSASPFEMTYGSMRVQLIRSLQQEEPSHITQSIYLGSFDGENPSLKKNILKMRPDDFQNLLFTLKRGDKSSVSLMKNMKVQKLKTPLNGWVLPKEMYPTKGTFQGIKLLTHSKIIIPQSASEVDDYLKRYKELNYPVEKVSVYFDQPVEVPLVINGGLEIPIDTEGKGKLTIQNQQLKGNVALEGLELADVTSLNTFSEEPKDEPFWLYTTASGEFVLPQNKLLGEPVLLPKSYREGGALIGDQGYLSYFIPTASSVQEQRIPIYVAGFYDQGISPIGGRFVIVDPEVTATIRSAYQDLGQTTGVNIRFDDLARADEVKEAIQSSLVKRGIDRYWNIETYKEYDFTKDLIQQLKSEKNLFSLIAAVIIIVACSNIVSMLIILVNDKKLEIGILRAMGASSLSISIIFGFCGMIMGFLGSVLGIGLAIVTLRNLDALIGFIGWMQGYDVFNAAFYGDTLPNQLSNEALSFVLIATVIASLIAGIVPAVKASLLKPSEILRAE